MSDPLTCDACGEPLTEPYPAHRRWRCPEVTSRMDVRDAAQAIGLPRDTALWKLLDVVAKRAAAAERARTAALDVEALARALGTERVRKYVMEAWVDEGVSQPGYATPAEMAAAIAREYAAIKEASDDHAV